MTKTSDHYLDKYPYALIKDLLWSRNYHKMLVNDIDKKLMELSRKFEITIPIDE
jgi:hypothetical protein